MKVHVQLGRLWKTQLTLLEWKPAWGRCRAKSNSVHSMHIASKSLPSKDYKSIYIVIVAVKAYHYELETENLIILVYARRTNRLGWISLSADA